MHARTWLSALSLPLVAAFTYPVLQRQQAPKPEAAPQAQDPLAGLTDIEDVLSLVQTNYVDRPDMEKVIGSGIQAALERAHPLNSLLSPAELRAADPGPADVGLVLLKRGGNPGIYAQVLAVAPNSPAAKAGMQPGDVIRRVDGESVGQLSAWALDRMLRGVSGSQVNLVRYANATGDLGKLTLTREVLKAAPIGVTTTPQGTVLALPDLNAGRAAELKKALENLDRSKPLVLDLRENAHGRLDEAGRVAGLFLPAGKLVTVQEQGRADQSMSFEGAGLAPFAKLIVVQNGTTLGTAEVLSACLKKGGASIVGEHSFGLGVEQSRVLLRQGGAVELVTKRWMGDGGEKLDRQGVTPTHAVRLVGSEDLLGKVLATLAAPPPAETKAKLDHA